MRTWREREKKRFITILPDMTEEEIIETTKIYTGYAGKIELELRALSTFTDSTYSYFPSQTQKAILHVGASSPNPTPARVIKEAYTINIF